MAEQAMSGGGMGTGNIAGVVNLGFSQLIKGQKKKKAKLADKHQALMNQLAIENQVANEGEADVQNAKAGSAINEDAAERGLGSSSIRNDNQTERKRVFANKKRELLAERKALESGIFTSDQMRKIDKKMASAQNTMNMINAVIGGGAGGAVDYYNASA